MDSNLIKKYKYKYIKKEENQNMTNTNNLLNRYLKDMKNKSFIDVVTFSSQIRRELSIADVDEEIAESIEALIKFWNLLDEEKNIPIEEREPIKIYIDSYGGLLTAAFTIIDAIKMSKTPIITINVGKAYSAGFFIFITGNKRVSYKNASFLYHEGSTGNARMDAGKFRNYAGFYEKELDKLKQITLSNTKITEEDYNKHQKDDWWLMADEALELEICDEITGEFIF